MSKKIVRTDKTNICDILLDLDDPLKPKYSTAEEVLKKQKLVESMENNIILLTVKMYCHNIFPYIIEKLKHKVQLPELYSSYLENKCAISEEVNLNIEKYYKEIEFNYVELLNRGSLDYLFSDQEKRNIRDVFKCTNKIEKIENEKFTDEFLKLQEKESLLLCYGIKTKSLQGYNIYCCIEKRSNISYKVVYYFHDISKRIV